MNNRRGFWFCLLALPLLWGLTSPNLGAQPKWEWKAFTFSKDAKPFFQKLETTTKQTMTVNSMEITQKQNQTFIIKWTPQKADKNDNYVVDQEIVALKMDIDIGGNKISYDSDNKGKDNNPMTQFFDALMEMKLTLTIDPKTMEVKSIDGRDKFVKKLGTVHPQMKPLLDSILSDKALKKMAEPTWAAFPVDAKNQKKGASWDVTNELNLGPIGTYKTKYKYTVDSFAPDEKKAKTAKITIKADLDYETPKSDKDKLPFKIKKAELKTSKSGTGYAVFDFEKGFIQESSIDMELKGDLTIEIGGMETKVELVQTQSAKVKTGTDLKKLKGAK